MIDPQTESSGNPERCLDCGKRKDEPGVPAICSAWHTPDPVPSTESKPKVDAKLSNDPQVLRFALASAEHRLAEANRRAEEWKHKAERGEVSGWKGRAESAERRLEQQTRALERLAENPDPGWAAEARAALAPSESEEECQCPFPLSKGHWSGCPENEDSATEEDTE